MGKPNRVGIGMDPHKRSATIEAMAGDEEVLGRGRFQTDAAGFEAMLAEAQQWPDRVWAVEGCEGIGKHLVLRLLDRGEPVVDVPAKLSARMRVYATGQGRKTDDTDAHSIALVAVRMTGLREVVNNETLEVLRLLVDRRRRIGEDHTRSVCETPPSAAGTPSWRREKGPVGGSGPQAPFDRQAEGRGREDPQTRRPGARGRPRAGLRTEEGREQGACRTGQADRDRAAHLHGIGPSGAARLLVEVGDVTRFPTKGHFASWTGTAPIDASSGDNVRHRLSRGGNRQINMALHMMAVVQLRNTTEGRAYYDRKVTAGKTPNE